MDELHDTAIARLFFPAPVRHSGALSTLLWWERRRAAFNAAVGGAGLVTFSAFALASLWPGTGIRILEMLPGVLIFAVLANVCYTSGWLVESLMRLVWKERAPLAGPLLFRQGVIFSVGVTLLPLVVLAIALGMQVGKAILG
jgi:hypothetical protein